MSLPVFIHPDLSAAQAGDAITLSGPEALEYLRSRIDGTMGFGRRKRETTP